MKKLFICLLVFCFSFVGFAYEWNVNSDTLTISGTGEMPDFKQYEAPWFDEARYIKKVKVNEGITRIGSYSFSDLYILDTVELPSSVKSIGDYAFYCSSIKSIDIPEGVETIDECVFSGCNKMTSFSMADSVVSLGREAFYRCYSLSYVKLSKNLEEICPLTFFCCEKLNKIIIPEGVKVICGYSFKSAGLISVSIPKSVEIIEEGAFEGTYLRYVNLPNKSVVIEINGFPPRCQLSDNRIVKQQEVVPEHFYP